MPIPTCNALTPSYFRGRSHISFESAKNFRITFTLPSGVSVRAIESGPAALNVRDATSGLEFTSPYLGTQYTSVVFVVSGLQTAASARYSYSAAGDTGQSIVDVKADAESIPVQSALRQNYPNPFNPSTAISYQLSAVSRVNLKVFDILGREVATLVDDLRQPGSYSIRWDAAGMTSGIYLYRLSVGDSHVTKKMILLR